MGKVRTSLAENTIDFIAHAHYISNWTVAHYQLVIIDMTCESEFLGSHRRAKRSLQNGRVPVGKTGRGKR
jgi:hypothetical protein